MGNATSRNITTNSNNQTVISQTNMKVLNKNVSTAVADALMKNNSSCSSVNEIDQLISFSGCRIEGDFNIGNVRQTAVVTVDFSCVNAFQAQNDMAQAILSEVMSQMASSVDAKSENSMDTTAEASATAGLFGGRSNASNTVDNRYNLSAATLTNTNIQNVIANNINASFSAENVQECINKQAVRQTQDYSNCTVGGNLNVNDLDQSASVAAVANCINDSGMTQKILNDSANALGVVVEQDLTVESTNDMTTSLKSVADSTVNLLGSCPGGSSGSSVIVIIAIIILVIVVVMAQYFLKKEGKSLSKDL